MKKVINNYTGLENLVFDAKLLSVSDVVQQNVNGTYYHICQVEIENEENGEKIQSMAHIWAKNYEKGVTPGRKYLTTAAPSDKGWYIVMSHLEQGAGMADLGNFFGVVAERTPEEAELPVV